MSSPCPPGCGRPGGPPAAAAAVLRAGRPGHLPPEPDPGRLALPTLLPLPLWSLPRRGLPPRCRTTGTPPRVGAALAPSAPEREPDGGDGRGAEGAGRAPRCADAQGHLLGGAGGRRGDTVEQAVRPGERTPRPREGRPAR